MNLWQLQIRVLLAGCLMMALAADALAGESPALRALSLRVLQERLQACQPVGQCPDKEVSQLGGITRLMGYVVDADNRDLLLVGTVESGLPALKLDDLVVALRSAWQRYAEQRSDTLYLTAPGCSIDPDPKVIRKLQSIGDAVLGATASAKGRSGEDQWRKTCELPQKVRLLGVPDSHFAEIMVTADYDLKRIVDGVAKVPVDGLSSVTDLVLADVKEQIRNGEAVAAGTSMNRFWFTAGEVRFAEGDGIVMIDQVPVVLRTEAELVQTNGEVLGSGGADPVADRFAKGFSQRYTQVAAIKPIYTELENLYRFVGLMQAVKFRDAHTDAGLDLGFLLDDYRLTRVKVSDTLPGRSNVARFSHREERPDGYRVFKLLMPSCGGVEIEIAVTDREFMQALPAAWRQVGVAARRARLSVKALYWDLNVPG